MGKFLLGSNHERCSSKKKKCPPLKHLLENPIWVCILLFGPDGQPGYISRASALRYGHLPPRPASTLAPVGASFMRRQNRTS